MRVTFKDTKKLSIPVVSIIVVNWNSDRQLYECLNSIAKCNKDGFILEKVIVVDNASTDSSLENINNTVENLIVIKNKKNLGFAKACNQGAKISTADYLLFLNPDTKLFNDTLFKSIKFINEESNDEIGILGVQLVNENGNISRSCSRFPKVFTFVIESVGLDKLFPKLGHFMREWDHKDSKCVDHVIGAFFLTRRSLYNKLNGFDERFFVYLEDLDFSYRAKQIGYKSFYFSSTKAYHKGGGTSEKIRAKRLFYSVKSSILYSYKHFGFFGGTMVMFAKLFVEPLSRSVYAIGKMDSLLLKETWKGYIILYKYLFTTIKKIVKSENK